MIFSNKRIIIPLLIVVALLFPFIVPNQYYIYIMTLSFIWIIAVYGLNIVAGYTGYLSLAHAGFFAIGAYSMGILTTKVEMGFWLAFILSPIITMIIGLFIGLFALRTKEHFFAIYTLCVGYIIYLLIDKWESLTGGVRGLIGIPPLPNIGPIELSDPIYRYYFVLLILLLSIFVIYRIINSLVGRTFTAIRNSENLALALGISTTVNKLLAFVLSTFFAGLAGVLYAVFIRFLGPEISSTIIMFDLLTSLIVGGIGTFAGPIVGTLLIVWVSQSLQFLEEYRMLVFGPILTLMIIFSPYGIVGLFKNISAKRKVKKVKVPIKTEKGA